MVEAINRLARFLARTDLPLPGTVDLILLLGNADPRSAAFAADLYFLGLAPRILVSGGIGHSTHFLHEALAIDTGTEADLLAEELLRIGVPAEAVLRETESTNCGANAVTSRAFLNSLGLDPKSVVLIQDPTMQRRSHASFTRVWEDRPEVAWHSYPSFVPRVVADGDDWKFAGNRWKPWTRERFLDLLLGEIPRLRDDEYGYGPQGRGFISHVDIPADVEAAHARLSEIVGMRSRAI